MGALLLGWWKMVSSRLWALLSASHTSWKKPFMFWGLGVDSYCDRDSDRLVILRGRGIHFWSL